MAGLLFLAFAYFAVAQAASHRNGAQTAADAAALAAAQDARDQLRTGWLEVVLDPDQWTDFLTGVAYKTGTACERAEEFAAANGAETSGEGCEPLDPRGFRVTVTTTGSDPRATATAEAVIEPLCDFTRPDPPTEEPPTEEPPTEEPPTGEPTPDPSPPVEEEPAPIEGLVCDGVPWEIDPERPVLPDAVDLFTVRLSE